MRYFIGVYKKNKNGRTVDLHTIDTDNIDLSLIEPDIDTYSFDDFIDVEKSQKIIIDDIVPEFVAPVVALVNDPKINDKIKIDINKKFQTIHTKNRTEDFKSIQHFKDLKNAETTLEEIKKNAAIGAELIKQMELSKRDVQKNIDEAIQKIQDLEEPDITPEEAAN